MSEQANRDGVRAEEVTAPKNWLQELEGRREEGIKVALRNFLVSRQFTTKGSLAEDERVVRFYEGVVMSLERNPEPDAFNAATSAFKDVIRYEVKPQEYPTVDWAKRSLRALAVYNLAVLFHRRAVQLRDRLETEKDKVKDNQPTSQIRSKAENLPSSAEAVLTHEGAQNPAAAESIPTSWRLTGQYGSRAENVQSDALGDGDLEKLIKNYNDTLEESDKRYNEVLDAIDSWKLDRVGWKVGDKNENGKHWENTILATGVSALVGLLLLRVERTAAGHALMPLSDGENKKLTSRIGQARDCLGHQRSQAVSTTIEEGCGRGAKQSEVHTDAQPAAPMSSDESPIKQDPPPGTIVQDSSSVEETPTPVRPDNQLGAKLLSAAISLLNSAAEWIRLSKQKGKQQSSSEPTDLGTDMLQKDMLRQLNRAANILGLDG